MTAAKWRLATGLWCIGGAAGLAGAQETRPAAPASRPAQTRPGAAPWGLRWPRGSFHLEPGVDDMTAFVSGGFEFESEGVMIRGQNAVAIFDRDVFLDAIGKATAGSGLPHRDGTPPDVRRPDPIELLRSRLRAFRARSPETVRSAETALAQHPSARSVYEAVRALYAEGEILLEVGGQRIARGEALYFSPLDDRMVVLDAEFTLIAQQGTPQEYPLVVRAAQVVRQGSRLMARDARVSTCTAGEPHWWIHAGMVEANLVGSDVLVDLRGNRVEAGSWFGVPMPDVSFALGDQSELLLRSVTAGVSGSRGAYILTRWGSTWNRLGGGIHEFLTGGNPGDFRGDWNLGLGASVKRGFPVEPELEYRARGAYEGRSSFFFLDDGGEDVREIRTELDGTLIDVRYRTIWRSENRFHLGQHTRLDVELFQAGDPAAYPEFYPGRYKVEEVKETSLHLRHAGDNLLLSATGRFNLNYYSYDDTGALSPSFVQEAPLLNLDWFSQPLFDIAEDVPLLLTVSASNGYLDKEYDPHVPPGDPRRPNPFEHAFRTDEEIELATPLALGPIGIRPFFSGRYTAWSDSPGGQSVDRFVFTGGVRVGTRLTRVFEVESQTFNLDRLRHVVSPEIQLLDRFQVTRSPNELFSFDRTDAMGTVEGLDETRLVRLVLLNRWQTRRAGPDGDRTRKQVVDFLWLDLAQNLFPTADRDNGGELVGLTEYELIYQPDTPILPIPGLRILFEGERDLVHNQIKTENLGVAFAPLPLTTAVFEWRHGADGDGTFDGRLHARFAGRWELLGGAQYDLDQDQFREYLGEIGRADHDWTTRLRVTYDRTSSELSLTLNFEPRLGGLTRRPSERQYVGDPEFGGLYERR